MQANIDTQKVRVSRPDRQSTSLPSNEGFDRKGQILPLFSIGHSVPFGTSEMATSRLCEWTVRNFFFAIETDIDCFI
jgi:hypothetical protein